jgi:hypothetical protein
VIAADPSKRIPDEMRFPKTAAQRTALFRARKKRKGLVKAKLGRPRSAAESAPGEAMTHAEANRAYYRYAAVPCLSASHCLHSSYCQVDHR